MHKFTYRFEFVIAGNFFLDEILDGFNVVISGAFDILDPMRIVFGEVFDQSLENMIGMLTESRYLRDIRAGGEVL